MKDYIIIEANEIQSKAIRNAIGIKIERYDKHNNLLEIHPSISNIVIRKLGNAGQIRMILKGVRMYSKGFYFKRHDEDIVQST